MSGGLAHSVQTRLVRHAHANRIDPNLLLTRYAAERLLYRLSRSRHAERFVLKGALLLLVWLGETIRPTRDADLRRRRLIIHAVNDDHPQKSRDDWLAISLPTPRTSPTIRGYAMHRSLQPFAAFLLAISVVPAFSQDTPDFVRFKITDVSSKALGNVQEKVWLATHESARGVARFRIVMQLKPASGDSPFIFSKGRFEHVADSKRSEFLKQLSNALAARKPLAPQARVLWR